MIKKIIYFILDLIVPLSCLGCQRDDVLLCKQCEEAIPIITGSRLKKPAPYLDYAYIATNYDDVFIKLLIKKYKFSGLHSLAQPLGRLIMQVLPGRNLDSTLVLMPIPLHKRKERSRGYNQSLLLSRVVAQEYNLTVNANLQRIKFTNSQSQLNRRKRLENVKGIFSWSAANTQIPHNILLIDDIATTFATLNSAAKELKRCGAERVGAAVIARNTDINK